MRGCEGSVQHPAPEVGGSGENHLDRHGRDEKTGQTDQWSQQMQFMEQIVDELTGKHKQKVHQNRQKNGDGCAVESVFD